MTNHLDCALLSAHVYKEWDHVTAGMEVLFSEDKKTVAFAGTDIKQFVDFRERGDGIDYERRIDAVIGGIERLETPTVALIDGYCVGGGAAIAMACDFRYANANFKFGIPIARTLGNCMSITNVARLVDLIGIARTKRVLMLAKMIGAEEALSVGLIDEIVESRAVPEE